MLDFNFTLTDVASLGDVPITAPAGRTTTMDSGEANVASIEVLSQPAFGRATANPDGTVALVLTGTTNTDPVTVPCRITYDNASQALVTFDVTVSALLHADGWGLGDFYLLDQDANGNTVVEPHPTTFKLHVSGDAGAWTKAAIESAEGLGTLSNDAFKAYIVGQSFYGSAAEPLTPAAGQIVWQRLASTSVYGVSSHWLLLERGYTYDKAVITPIWDRMRGRSPLHPIVVRDFGTGTRPKYEDVVNASGGGGDGGMFNVVFIGIDFEGGYGDTVGGHNHLFENIKCREFGISASYGFDSFTLRQSILVDGFHDSPKEKWTGLTFTFAATDGSNELLVTASAAHGQHAIDATNSAYDTVRFIEAVGLGGNVTAGVINTTLPIVEIVNSTQFKVQIGVTANASDTGNGGPARGYWYNWEPNYNRISCFYGGAITGGLFEDNFLDKAGWDDGYDDDTWPDPALPQPPSDLSHVYYFANENWDLTIRRNIISRGASTGVQYRPGGVIEDCLLLDNNIIANVSGGGETNWSNYSLILGTVATSAAERYSAAAPGGLNWGWDNNSLLTTYLDNIVCHAADPNNPTEIGEKTTPADAIMIEPSEDSVFYNNTKVRNWKADANLTGLDTGVLDATTIQLFTDELLTASGSTIEDFANHFRTMHATTYTPTTTVLDVLDWFRISFNIPTSSTRSVATTLRLIPDERGDGVRWDNRLNWDSGDVPITNDNINLAGNVSYYGGTGALTIGNLALGTGGSVWGSGGKLTIGGTISGTGTLTATRAMQYWFPGTAATVSIVASGGRIVNTGDVTGTVTLSVSGQAQALLATTDGGDWAVGAGSITITGSECLVGFDGESAAAVSLTLGASSTLTLVADASGFGQIAEVVSGAFTSSVAGTVVLGGTLALDPSALTTGDYDLIDVTTITGTFASFADITNASASHDLTITISGGVLSVNVASGTGQVINGDA